MVWVIIQRSERIVHFGGRRFWRKVRMVGKENIAHTIRTIKKAGYELSKDWAGALY